MAFQDGDLSNLCGVYAIVNAYQYLHSASSRDCEDVFYRIIKYLSRKRQLAGSITGGILFKQMKNMLNEVEGLGMKYSILWASYPNPSTKVFWHSMKDSMVDGELCVITGITGLVDHWTLGISATDRAMKLIDSGSWKFLKYNMCTTQYNDPGMYVLYPAQTFFIRKSNETI